MSATAQITGRLGFDPELNYTHGGTPVVNVSVANHRRVKAGEEKQSIADWYKITLFGRDAEIIAQHARKGSALAFNGRLQMEHYADRDGNARSSVVLIANSFEFMPGVKREPETTTEHAAPAVTTEELTRELTREMDEDLAEADIPF